MGEEEDELHEEVTNKGEATKYGCMPDQIGRRREDPYTNGGRCSCRRRDGMSSTGMYGCKGNTMEYYGGGDADARRRGSPSQGSCCSRCWSTGGFHSGYDANYCSPRSGNCYPYGGGPTPKDYYTYCGN